MDLVFKQLFWVVAACLFCGLHAAFAGGAKLPTLWIIGDSTVNNSTKGLEGWGSEVHVFFDSKRINVENRARGGRSSRSYLEEGLWDEVLKEIKKGDFVMMQFGHNDGGGKYFDDRGRASIHGTGDETEEGNLPDGTHAVVHSYGWYLRRYIADAKSKGALPIVISPIPRNRWSEEGEVLREDKGYGGWAKETAKEMKVPFLDLNKIVADKYDKMGPEKVKDFFPGDWTHTNSQGARFNANCVAAGLSAMDITLKRYMVNSSKMRRLLQEY